MLRDVISKLRNWEIVFPCGFHNNICLMHVLNNLIYLFCLSIKLRVLVNLMLKVVSNFSKTCVQKSLTSKLLILITHNIY